MYAYQLRDAARWLDPWDETAKQQSRLWQCGRVTIKGEKRDAYFGQRANKDVGIYGTQSCGSVWNCSVCRSRAACHHAGEIAQSIERWQQRGGSCSFFSLTTRHRKTDKLSDLIDGLIAALARFTTGRAWHAWRTKHGVEYVLALDLTYSERNGWHAHVHGILFTESELEADETSAWLHDQWATAVRACMGVKHVGDWWHAVDCQPVSPDAGELGKYIAKLGFEVTPAMKGADSDTQWSLLAGAHELHRRIRYMQDDDERARAEAECKHRIALWHEYTSALKRKRWVRWSNKIRDLVGLGDELDDSDADSVASLVQKGEVQVVARVPHELRRRILYHSLLPRIIQDGLERGIPIEPLLEPYLSAVELAIWQEANTRERLDELRASIKDSG